MKKAQPAGCFSTNLPADITQRIVEEIEMKSPLMKQGTTDGKRLNTKVRNCKLSALKSAEWFGGFLWHYISRMNRENFLYDITCIENESISYIVYNTGDYYTWHVDQDIVTSLSPDGIPTMYSNFAQEIAELQGEYVRKLSFSFQLSSPDEYTGGNLQVIRPGFQTKPEMVTVPNELGLMTVFDSRLSHRVTKVKSGTRKVLVGWVMGPRWK